MSRLGSGDSTCSTRILRFVAWGVSFIMPPCARCTLASWRLERAAGAPPSPSARSQSCPAEALSGTANLGGLIYIHPLEPGVRGFPERGPPVGLAFPFRFALKALASRSPVEDHPRPDRGLSQAVGQHGVAGQPPWHPGPGGGPSRDSFTGSVHRERASRLRRRCGKDLT